MRRADNAAGIRSTVLRAEKCGVFGDVTGEFRVETVWDAVGEDGAKTTCRDHFLPAGEPFTIPWLVGTALALAVAAVKEEDEP